MEKVLIGVKCSNCRRIFLPPKYMCPECYSMNFDEVQLSGKGEIQAFTTIYVPPIRFKDDAPYDVVLIRLEEGVSLLSRIIKDKDEKIETGAKVSFIEKKEGTYYFKLY